MNRLTKTESDIFVSLLCSLLPEDLNSELTSCAILPFQIFSIHHCSSFFFSLIVMLRSRMFYSVLIEEQKVSRI